MEGLARIERLKAARHKLAQLVLMDAVYAPIFERLEAEIAAAEAEQDLVARARAVARLQRAIA